MPDTKLHYKIAKQLLLTQDYFDEDAFILGSVLPDSGIEISYRKYQPDTNITHFAYDNHKYHIDEEQFLIDYLPKCQNHQDYSLVIGYYMHLLIDRYFVMKISLPFIEANNIAKDDYEHIKIIQGEWRYFNDQLINEDIILNYDNYQIIDFIKKENISHLKDKLAKKAPKVELKYTNFDDYKKAIDDLINTLALHLSLFTLGHKDYTCLLFDLDNTIFDFTKAEHIALNNTFKLHGLNVNEKLINTYLKINSGLWKDLEKGLVTKKELEERRFTNTLKELNLKGDGLALASTYALELAKGSYYLKGAKEALISLKDQYEIDIITNGISHIQHPRINNSDLKDYVKHIFVSSDIGYDKPSHEYYQYVSDHIEEKEKANLLIIGDSLSSDIQMAKNEGIDYLFIKDPINANIPSFKSIRTIDYYLKYVGFFHK